MTRRVLGLGAGIVGAILVYLLVAGSSTESEPVTEAEARAHLDRLVAAAQSSDFDGLCNLAGAVRNCRHLLDEAGRDAAPSVPPAVESATYREAETDDGTSGWVLVVRGTDRRGRSYRTEVLIFRDHESQVKATNAVYWSNARISFGDPNSPASPHASNG